MTRSADSELAAHRSRSFGTAGELRLLRRLTISGSLIWTVIPLLEATDKAQTVTTRPLHSQMHYGNSHISEGSDHSTPIDRNIVERFSPTRL